MNTLEEKDWIIVRLLRVLLQDGHFASHSDVIKTAQWFEHEHRDFGNRSIGGEISYGPLYGTGTAKLTEAMKRVQETPVFDRDTGKWR